MNMPLLGAFMTDSLLAILPWNKTRPCMSRRVTFAPMGAPDIWMWSATGTASKWTGTWTATMPVCFSLELDFPLELDFALLELDFALELEFVLLELDFSLLEDSILDEDFALLEDSTLDEDFSLELDDSCVPELDDISLELDSTLELDSMLELDSTSLEDDSSVSELDEYSLLEEMMGFSISCVSRNSATYSLTISALKVG